MQRRGQGCNDPTCRDRDGCASLVAGIPSCEDRHENTRRRRLSRGPAARRRNRGTRRSARPARCWSRSGPAASATPTSSRGPAPTRRALPGDLRPRGRRRGRRRGPGVTSLRKGDHVIPLYTPGVPAVQVVPVAQDQPVHGDPRHAGPGRDAGRHQPVLDRRREDPPLHGLLDVLELHGAARDRAREDPRGRAVRQGLLHRLRRHDRHRRGDQHGPRRARRQRRGVRPRRHRS